MYTADKSSKMLAMKQALKELGYNEIHHMTSVFESPQSADFWTAALEAKFERKGVEFDREAWDHMLGDCMV